VEILTGLPGLRAGIVGTTLFLGPRVLLRAVLQGSGMNPGWCLGPLSRQLGSKGMETALLDFMPLVL
jgi:hypothetical protein